MIILLPYAVSTLSYHHDHVQCDQAQRASDRTADSTHNHVFWALTRHCGGCILAAVRNITTVSLHR